MMTSTGLTSIQLSSPLLATGVGAADAAAAGAEAASAAGVAAGAAGAAAVDSSAGAEAAIAEPLRCLLTRDRTVGSSLAKVPVEDALSPAATSIRKRASGTTQRDCFGAIP